MQCSLVRSFNAANCVWFDLNPSCSEVDEGCLPQDKRERSGSVEECLTRDRGHRFEPYWRHCVVSLSKNINPSLVLVQPWKACPFIAERFLMGRKESNQTNKNLTTKTKQKSFQFPVIKH